MKFIILLILAFSAVGCSLPRIIVLEDPLSAEEHLNLGVAYEGRGEWENALREYGLASKELPLAFLYLGNVHFRINEFDAAEKNYKKAIKMDSNNADAHNNLAWLYFTREVNLAAAETHALKAIELNPEKKEVYSDTLNRIRELSAAESYSKKSGASDP